MEINAETHEKNDGRGGRKTVAGMLRSDVQYVGQSHDRSGAEVMDVLVKREICQKHPKMKMENVAEKTV